MFALRQDVGRGFTLVELVSVISIVALLAAFAIPRFVNMGTQARVAAVRTLAGALDSASYSARAACMATADSTGCNLGSAAWTGTINGSAYWLNYGWLDAGDVLGSSQIDAFVDFSGFRAYLVGPPSTRFVRDDAPSPDRCSVTYYDAYFTPPKYHYVIDVSGC